MQTDSPPQRSARRDPLPHREAAVPFPSAAPTERIAGERHLGAGRPTVLMIGASPPPYHGSIMMFRTLMTSPLQERFRLVHLDISDHRSLENMGRLDLENVRLGVRHALDCL